MAHAIRASQLTASLRFILATVASVPLCVAAFLRGNYLLGPGCGCVYAAITLGLVFLFARSRTALRAAAVTVMSLAAGFMMAWPASINPTLQYSIDRQADDRAVRAEAAALFESDPAYRDLSISTVHLKAINVTVSGSVGTWSELDRPRSQIAVACPKLTKCVLHWDVTLQESGERLRGLDRNMFPEAQST